MASSFVVWESIEEEHGCFLKRIEGVERKWDLTKGVPRKKGFASDALMRMDANAPHDTILFDFVDNVNRFIVVSPALTEFLTEQNISHVEYLPFRIIDHKGRVASNDYRILHPLQPIDCLDAKESNADWSTVDEESINSVDRLVLIESKIPKTRAIVRVKHFYQVVLVRRSLAEAISAQGFTNIRWTEPENYAS